MALKFIETTCTFSEPGILTTQRLDVGGTIYKEQATIVLQGVETGYSDEKEHNLKLFKVRVTNVRPRDTWIEFDLDFNFLDDGDHVGSATIDLVAIADVE